MCKVKFCVWRPSCKVSPSILYLECKEHLGRMPTLDRARWLPRNILQESEGTESRTVHPTGLLGSSDTLCVDHAYGAFISRDKARVLTLGVSRASCDHPAPSNPPCVPLLRAQAYPDLPRPSVLATFVSLQLSVSFSTQLQPSLPLNLRNLYLAPPPPPTPPSPPPFSPALGPRAQGQGCLHLLSGSLLDHQLHQ